MQILFHKLYRDQHAKELRDMQPEVADILRTHRAQRDLHKMRIAMARAAKGVAV